MKLVLTLELLFAGIVVTSSCANTKEESQATTWQEWSKDKKVVSYMSQMKKITDEIKKQDIPIDLEFKENLKLDQQRVLTLKQLHALGLSRIKKLSPPRGLEIYHQKMIDSFTYGEMLIDALSAGEAISVRLYLEKSISSGIQASEEIRNLYLELNAPQELVDVINKAILSDKEVLKKILPKDQQNRR